MGALIARQRNCGPAEVNAAAMAAAATAAALRLRGPWIARASAAMAFISRETFPRFAAVAAVAASILAKAADVVSPVTLEASAIALKRRSIVPSERLSPAA